MEKYRIERILTIVRILLLNICVGLSSVYAASSFGQTKIDINVKAVSFEELFKEIQNKSEYIFFYQDNVLEINKKVSVRSKNAELTKILDKAFTNTSLAYKITGRQVVIKKIPEQTDQITTTAAIIEDVEIKVTGRVLDTGGLPLPGVNILIQGTQLGTQTDFDGYFSLDVEEDAVLVFSFVGMTTQTISVGNQTTINVTMEEDVAKLQELVVVGYSTQSKE